MRKTNIKTKRFPRLKPRKYSGFGYVLVTDILSLHGSEWNEKFTKIFGIGNTCPLIPAKHESHGRKAEQMGIYYSDYLRFADWVDYGQPTFWD